MQSRQSAVILNRIERDEAPGQPDRRAVHGSDGRDVTVTGTRRPSSATGSCPAWSRSRTACTRAASHGAWVDLLERKAKPSNPGSIEEGLALHGLTALPERL